ncbi:MAG: CotH kinase family protein, partial [Deltaproteobacteria bacterium]|nr:CotH kinase family protein [Deltaproteobacteria bacterium]
MRNIDTISMFLIGMFLVGFLPGFRVAAAEAAGGKVVINELLASNKDTNRDEDGHSSDWLELYNPSPARVNLSGYRLSDDLADQEKWIFPDVSIPPGGYLLLWMSGKNRCEQSALTGIVHASFRLSKRGGRLFLIDPRGELVDRVKFPKQMSDQSYGRSPDGSPAWFYFVTPTPHAANTKKPFFGPLNTKVEISPPPGRHPRRIEVNIVATTARRLTIRYTTDGTRPTIASPVFTDTFYISDNTIVRAAGFIGSERATKELRADYFIGLPGRLPILSLLMDKDEFSFVQLKSRVRGRAAERGARLVIIGDNGREAVSTGVGLRLHGQVGRLGDFDAKKSFRIYFRRKYGVARLAYPVIPGSSQQKFDVLVLRALFDDRFRKVMNRFDLRSAYIRDQVIRDLHREMGGLSPSGSWYILFVNMQFRGLYNLVERIDEDFLQAQSKTSQWDLIRGEHQGDIATVGTIEAWDTACQFIASSDLSQQDFYEKAKQYIDIKDFTGYIILNLWAQNFDWPITNWYAAKLRIENAKWVFFCWDSEFAFDLDGVGIADDSMKRLAAEEGCVTKIFNALMKSPAYRAYFGQELERHLAGVLKT